MGYLAPLPLKYKAVVGAGIACLSLLAVSAVSGDAGVMHLRRLRAQQAQIEKTAFVLGRRNAELREHLERLEKDDSYLEKVVRERLGWIKPGERVYRVVPRDSEPR